MVQRIDPLKGIGAEIRGAYIPTNKHVLVATNSNFSKTNYKKKHFFGQNWNSISNIFLSYKPISRRNYYQILAFFSHQKISISWQKMAKLVQKGL